jgi:hypothetical protein
MAPRIGSCEGRVSRAARHSEKAGDSAEYGEQQQAQK